MTGSLGIVLQSALQKDGPNNAPPDDHQEVDTGDFQPNKISLKLLVWNVAINNRWGACGVWQPNAHRAQHMQSHVIPQGNLPERNVIISVAVNILGQILALLKRKSPW